jgi:hypothetical protein
VIANVESPRLITCVSPIHNGSGLVSFEIHDDSDHYVLSANVFRYYDTPVIDGLYSFIYLFLSYYYAWKMIIEQQSSDGY